MFVMIVKFMLPQNDEAAQEMVARFKRDGFAPLATADHHCGFIREVGDEQGKIIIKSTLLS